VKGPMNSRRDTCPRAQEGKKAAGGPLYLANTLCDDLNADIS